MQLKIVCPGPHVGITDMPTLHACLYLLFVVIPKGVQFCPLHRAVAWSPQSTEQGLRVVKQGSLALEDVERVFMFVEKKVYRIVSRG